MLPFAQVADPPTPAPAPPSIDIGGLVNGIVQGFQAVLSGWASTLPDQVGTNSTDLAKEAWNWLDLSGMNFVFGTPLALVKVGAAVIAPGDVRLLMTDVTQLALLLAALSYVGRYFFGWPGLGETVSRIVTTIIVVGSSYRLLDLSIQFEASMLGNVSGRRLGLPDIAGSGLPPLVVAAGVMFWLALAIRLGYTMGKRIIWLATLYPLAPVALATGMHAKAAWIASTFVRLWIGYLFGQVIAVTSLLVSVAMLGTIGGPGGFILSLAALGVATEAVKILAPKEGLPSVSVGAGYGPFKLSL